MVENAAGKSDRRPLLNLTISGFRRLAGLLPLRIGIDRCSRILVPVMDLLFDGFEDHEICVGQLVLSVSSESPQERVLAYFCHDVVYKFKSTPLFKVMQILHTSHDEVFVNVGAHFGMYSLVARNLGYKVLLFEPERTCYRFLNKNGCLGDAHQVE